MSRVSGVTRAGIPSRPSSSASRLAPGFSVEGDDPAPAVQENPPAQSVALAGMLALQEAETETVQDKTARRHGIALLQMLSNLQKTLLMAPENGAAEAASLALLANEMPNAANPGLASTLAAIRLRAKIELLRRGIEIP